MTKIVHLVYSPESSGKAALRIHRAFTEAGMDSKILSLHQSTLENDKIKYLGRIPIWHWKFEIRMQKFLAKRIKMDKQYGIFTYPVFGADLSKLNDIKNADVIYLHWVLWGLLNLKTIEKLAKLNKPIIFFMHDMWTITGGCHHSFACNKYTYQCSSCQVFVKKRKKDFSWFGFNKKKRFYSKFPNLHFVSPSRWLYSCAKDSALTADKPLYHIPNIIDTKLFKPTEKKTAKEILNINPDHLVFSFGAISVDSPYKGWAYLKTALEILHNEANIKDVTVLVFGNGLGKEIESQIPFNIKYLGYINDEIAMNLVYNATDIFIAPSLAEVFGYVIFEALCCGTPVVGFDVGGIPDLIKHKYNGYLAKYKDAEDLAAGIKYCLDNKITGKILPELEPGQILKQHKALIGNLVKPVNK
jgi:glycosyltransferase involved in cell wall biosynthesis